MTDRSEAALILAPRGRDAQLAASILAERDMTARVCATLPQLVAELEAGAGLAIVTEEVVAIADLAPVARWIGAQPEWSDFPFILLTQRGGIERNPAAARHLENLGNVTFLERPFHPTSLISLAQAALRSRRRQYEARDRLEAIRTGQQRLSVALAAGGLGNWTLDSVTGALDASDDCKAHYGRAPDDSLSYADLRASVHSDDAERMQAAVAHSGKTGDDYDIEYRCIWPDGTVHWVAVNGRVEYAADGSMARMVGVSRDITETRNRLDVIAQGERRLKVALDAGGLGTWSLDFDARTIAPSTECKAHFGRGEADTLDWDGWIASIHPEDTALVEKALAASMADGRDYVVEYRCIWPDGSVHWVQVHGRVEQDSGAPYARMAGVTQDVTRRRADEETLRALAAELEERVEERTREHERVTAQLHEAQKLETIGQLTGGVAHDFNNLLTPIMGALDLIQRRLPGGDAQLRDLVGNALQSSERARTLVQRLLGFARRTRLETVAVDLGALAGSMLDLVRSSVGSTIAVELRIDPDLPPALADPNQVELALLNLCVNARDAMPGGGTLTLRVRGGKAPAGLDGEYLAITVADSGSGMDEETMRRAVEPFFSTKETGRGTGLGLSMVHGLAAQLGGAFVLESEVGRGTQATLWLPVTERVTQGQVGSAAHAIAAPARALKVLLVDDEPLVRMGTAAMLRDLGHEVTEASGGNEALSRLLSEERPDILVTDYRMPGMDGPELIRQVRAADPKLRVLLVTGYGGEDVYIEGVNHLAKPFGQGEIARALEAAVG